MRDTKRAKNIRAAAITLRAGSGRDRKQAVRIMATTWKVARYEKVDDKSKNCSVSAVAKNVEAAVNYAALKLKATQEVLQST